MRLDDEWDAVLAETVGEELEAIDCHRQPGVRYGHPVSVCSRVLSSDVGIACGHLSIGLIFPRKQNHTNRNHAAAATHAVGQLLYSCNTVGWAITMYY